MGGRVSIVNKTSFTIKVQLCHLSPLYTKELEPNEVWSQETGAVHFTIKVDVQPRPEANQNSLKFGAQTGVIFNANTVLESEKWKENQAEKYFHLTSNGWYFKGDNELEICGGPILKSGQDIYRVNSRHHCDNVDLTLQQLKVVRKEKREKKQNSLTPKPPRKAWRSRSQSIGRSMRESIRSSKDSTPVEEKAVFGDRIEDCPPLTRLESHESALDAFFANLPQGAPHIKVQRISK